MPITLTITDDQALEIMAQVSKALAYRKGELFAPPPAAQEKDSGNTAKLVRKAVSIMLPNQTFRNIDLQLKLNGSCAAVSRALKRLQADGKVKMLKRGTWQIAA